MIWRLYYAARWQASPVLENGAVFHVLKVCSSIAAPALVCLLYSLVQLDCEASPLSAPEPTSMLSQPLGPGAS